METEKVRCMNERGHYVYINPRLVAQPNYLRQNKLTPAPEPGKDKIVVGPDTKPVISKSIELSPAPVANAAIRKLTTADAVIEFLDGETRKGVRQFAEEHINTLNNAG